MNTPADTVAPRSSLTRLALDAAGLAAAVPGAALAAGLGITALVRRDKPLHPDGLMADGTLVLTGGETGVPFLDEPANLGVAVRFSWATGRGPEGSDIHGLALRLELDGTLSDWLFASTGSGRGDRFMLTTRPSGRYGTLTTLLPVSSPAGPLVLRAEPVGPSQPAQPPLRHDLSAATGTGPWQPVGYVEVEQWGADRDVHFDAVRHPVPGCTQYLPVTVLREPAYAVARLLGPG